MSGIHSYSIVHDAKLGLHAAARAVFAGDTVDVVFGFRWPTRERDWVAVTDAQSDIDPATIGPRRSVHEVITLEVSIGSWRAGHDEATEIATSERAFDLLNRLQEYIRLHDITLGGAVLWCMPGSLQVAGATTAEDIGEGRLTEIAAQFVCEHRIR